MVPGTGLLLCTGPDGILLTDIASICLSWVDYYSNLFSARAIDMSAQDTSSNLCGGLFSLSEAS